MTVKEFFSNKIIRFLLLGGTVYVVWMLLYELVIRPYTPLDFYVNFSITQISQWLFSIMGVETFIDIESDHVVLVTDPGMSIGVWIGDQCNGLKLFAIFSLLIILLPGNRKSKYWFIPVGLLIIHAANIFRVMMLLIIFDKYPQFLDFNHKYTFTIFVYAVIFALWLWWAKKYAGNESQD